MAKLPSHATHRPLARYVPAYPAVGKVDYVHVLRAKCIRKWGTSALHGAGPRTALPYTALHSRLFHPPTSRGILDQWFQTCGPRIIFQVDRGALLHWHYVSSV